MLVLLQILAMLYIFHVVRYTLLTSLLLYWVFGSNDNAPEIHQFSDSIAPLAHDDASRRTNINAFPYNRYSLFQDVYYCLVPMSSPHVSPLRQLWNKWKALQLPWRKRWLAGNPHVPSS